ncbi:MAG: flavodoxin domain-containing protein [Burkholderiales bacterium]
MPLDLIVLVGTMTGTAQLVAQELELLYGDDDACIRVMLMDGLEAKIFSEGGLFLICTSTYGQGDVPDNAKQLFESLQSSRPALTQVEYGVIGLGDRTYAETFCFGGKRFDQLLSELGARRIGEPMLHDASAGTMAEEVAAEWAQEWLALCRSRSELVA